MAIYSQTSSINSLTESYDIINEDKKEINLYGNFLDGAFGKIILDRESKTFKITRMNFDKFLIRLKEMYDSKKLNNLFDKKYSAWSQMLWEKEKITKDRMKIVELEFPLFFAIEVYRIFIDLGDFYKLRWYNEVANRIYEKTWISNYETRRNIKTNTAPLDKLKFPPLPYQLEFIKKYQTLKHIYDLEGYILSFDQGLGKTYTSIGLSECLYKDQIIIVCPNSLKENWAFEIREYFESFSDESIWKSKVFVCGNSKYQYNANTTKYLIINQESVSKIYPYIKNNKNTMIIVDESHNFRNIETKRTQELLELKNKTKCKDNLLMSGTPIKATPDELVPALLMIDPYFTEELAHKFIRAFNSDNTEISRIVKTRFDRVIYRKTKSEVLTLPNKTIKKLKYRIPSPEKYYITTIREEIFKEFTDIYQVKLKDLEIYRKEFNELINKYSSAPKKETEAYLNYITNNTDPKEDNMIVHEKRLEYYNAFIKQYVYPNIWLNTELQRIQFLEKQYIHMNKVAMGLAIGKVLPPARNNCFIDIYNYNYQDIIKIIESCSKKTVIFTQFLKVANYISEDLNKKGIKNVKIVGETKDRMDLINKFKYSDEIEVLIATSQTLSTGVTLTEASQMFFFGTPYRSADFNQACDRIHRIGQTSDVVIYNILLDTDRKLNISTRIEDILEWSGEMFDSMIDNQITY